LIVIDKVIQQYPMARSDAGSQFSQGLINPTGNQLLTQ
jgi:hypothetical protein